MKRPVCKGVLAAVALLMIVLGVFSTLYFYELIDWFIHKELVLKEGSETFEMWRSPPLEPEMRIYFFNLTNPAQFLEGKKPRLRQVGPYVYREKWEKVNVAFHANGSVSYEPKKTFHFVPQASAGDETDLLLTMNIPLISGADQVKWSSKMMRQQFAFMLPHLKQTTDTLAVRTVKQLLWGYDDSLFSIAKDLHGLPHNQFGLLAGKNDTTDGVFTVHTGKHSMANYGEISNWNGRTSLGYWKTEACNAIYGSDGTAFPPDLTTNTTLFLFNPEFCRVLPLVYKQTVTADGIEAYRFVPPADVFDSVREKPQNDCYCVGGPPCSRKGLFNISACKFGAPLSISWPHFLHADPKLLEDVQGLKPSAALHEFYIDLQPKLAVAVEAKARMQINLHLSKVDDIPQVAGIRDLVLPIFWFESGVDSLPDHLLEKMKMVADMPAVARAGISYFLFVCGGLLLFFVTFLTWKQVCHPPADSKVIDKDRVTIDKLSNVVVVHGASAVDV